jgi:hypothetical protein
MFLCKLQELKVLQKVKRLASSKPFINLGLFSLMGCIIESVHTDYLEMQIMLNKSRYIFNFPFFSTILNFLNKTFYKVNLTLKYIYYYLYPIHINFYNSIFKLFYILFNQKRYLIPLHLFHLNIYTYQLNGQNNYF